jgi:uncharacterized protein (TIGR02118 family)
MVKLVCLIRRPASMSHDEFRSWWLDHHAPLVRGLPDLRRYTISVTDDGDPYDGVAELWYDSVEAMDGSFASELGQEVSREDREAIGERIAFLTEEHVIR